MSPRLLRIGDLWGEWISPSNSILQGCGSSNSWARALLYRLLQDLHSRFPVQIGLQVDDINHHSQGTFFQALHWSVVATCMLDRGLTSLGLTLSQNKSVIVASHSPIAACRSARAAGAGDILRRCRFRSRRGPRCECWAQEISQNSNQEGAEMSQKKSPHQSHTEWVETQASDNEVVQNWDPASRGLRARWDGHVPELCPAQEDDGCRCVWKEERDRAHYNNPTLSFWREWGPNHLVSARSASNLAGAPRREMGHRQERIDVARAWAAASADMKKKSRWSTV